MSKKLTTLVLVALFFVFSSPASAYYLVKMDGDSLSVFQGQVLGDEDSQEEQKPEQQGMKEPPKMEQRREDKKEERKEERPESKPQNNEKRLDKKMELNKDKKRAIIDPKQSTLSVQQQTPENAKKVGEMQKKRVEMEKELRMNDKKLTVKEKQNLKSKIDDSKMTEDKLNSRVLNKIEDDTFEIESEGKMKIRFEEGKDRRVGETGDQEVEQEGEIEIEDGEARVRTKLPVGVDGTTDGLVLKTEDGEIVTPNTPNAVLEKLQSSKVLDELSSDDQGEAQSEIVVENNKAVYNLKGSRSARLFGFLPVNIKKEVKVSADTGEVLETKQGRFSRFFESLSN